MSAKLSKTAVFSSLTLALVFFLCLQACAPEQNGVSTPEESATRTDVNTSVRVVLEGVENARDLGAYEARNGQKIRSGRILRSGELSGLTETDKATLRQELHVEHIIDLRDEVETEYAPDPVLEGISYHHFNVWPRETRLRNIEESTIGGITDSLLFREKYYTVFALDPSAIAAYRSMFALLLTDGDGAVLIHCTHGKDRTGIAATLILSALDVSWEQIEAEYLLSNELYPDSVDIQSLRYYRSLIEENYGSMAAYLESEMELDENALTFLREKYLTP